VETAGALADMIKQTMTVEYHDLRVTAARVHIIDLGHALLGPFSERAHAYAAKVLRGKGVELHLGVKVTEVGHGKVTLADGTTIETHCVVWGGGITAPPVAAATGINQGAGGRIDVLPDLTVEGFANFYAVGDVANIKGPDGGMLPQLGSVALQSGVWAAGNLLAGFAGEPRRPFHYKDKGIMAMIGRSGLGQGSAIAAMGPKRREIHGPLAFAAWLGVHAMLMTGVRTRIETVIDWCWAYFSKTRGPQILDRASAAQIDWSENGSSEPAQPDPGRTAVHS
jgi:NADH:ubiquinone reductase (H+-translocating)